MTADDDQRQSSWTDGGVISLGRSRPGWIDVVGMGLAAVAANSVVAVVMGLLFPVSQQWCQTYATCDADPHMDAHNAWARLAMFAGWALLSTVIVWRWRRRWFVVVLVVQVVALALITATSLSVAI